MVWLSRQSWLTAVDPSIAAEHLAVSNRHMGIMDLDRQIVSLERFSKILPATVRGISQQTATWKPAPDRWSILEVVCHLADEEVEDFRQRVRLTIESPGTAWPPIDPPQAAIDRKYNEQNLDEVLDRFLTERAASLTWLRSLDDVDWDQFYDHPQWGPMAAGRVMAAWVAHDWLHLRQISKRFFEMAEQDGKPYDVRYAGEWTA